MMGVLHILGHRRHFEQAAIGDEHQAGTDIDRRPPMREKRSEMEHIHLPHPAPDIHHQQCQQADHQANLKSPRLFHAE